MKRATKLTVLFSTLCVLIQLQAWSQSNTVNQNDITGISSTYNGFWSSTAGAVSSVHPDSAHDLTSFQADGVNYSTGVDDAALSTAGMIYSAGNYAALVPTLSISSKAGQGAMDDGSSAWAGQLHPTSGNDVSAYITDGAQGLGLSTFANNCGATFTYTVVNIDKNAIGDGIPDIIYFNNAAGASTNVELVFKDIDGDQLGSIVKTVEGRGRANIAKFSNDRFRTNNGNSTATNSNQSIQGFYLELSDFKLKKKDIDKVATLELVLPPQADPPFVAYNTVAFLACASGDDDEDGICNAADNCPNSPIGSDVDSNGCQVLLDVELSTNSDACSNAIVPYHISIKNNNSVEVPNVSVQDILPNRFTFLDQEISLENGATQTIASNPSEGASTLNWAEFNLPPGASVMISYSVLVENGIPVGSYSNEVSIVGARMDTPTKAATYLVNSTVCNEVIIPCEPAFYQVYKRPGEVNTYGQLNTATGEYGFIANLTPSANALGYDTQDKMAYGANGKRFISLDSQGLIQYLGVDFNNNVFSGDTDGQGYWYGRDGNDLIKINLTNLSALRFNNQGIPGWDMAINIDGNLYSIHGTTLWRFNTTSNSKESVGTITGDLASGSGFGAQWTGSDGYHYASHNSTGNVYRIDVNSLESRQVMSSEGGLRLNDGFSCPNAIPSVYSVEYSDNSSYGAASAQNYVSDLSNNGTPTYGMTWAGAKVSSEVGYNANADADSDLYDDGLDYESGITPGETTPLSISLNTNMNSVETFYGMWIDWNDDGTFDDFFSGSEVISSPSTVVIDALVPGTGVANILNVRLRVSEEEIINAHSSGHMEALGEVEDYRYMVSQVAEICNNGDDDDLDGLIDCADPDCASVCTEICYNCIDDDGDGQIDGDDSNCPNAAYQNCFEVNTLTDTGDDNPGDGICADGSGNCSLRAALEEANTLSGYNCVNFGIAGTINLNAPLVITDAVMIDGTSAPGYVPGNPAIHALTSGKAIVITEADDVMVRGLDLSAPAGGFSSDGIDITLSANVTVLHNRINNRARGVKASTVRDITIKHNDLLDSGNECWDAAIYLNDVIGLNLAGGMSVADNAMGALNLDPQTALHISNSSDVIISDGSIPGTNVTMAQAGYDTWHPIRIIDMDNVRIESLDLSYTQPTMFGIGVWTVRCDNVVINDIKANNRARAVYVDNGSQHTISNSDFRDTGMDADNGTFTWENYNINSPSDAIVSGNLIGANVLSAHTLLTLYNCNGFVISDGTETATNIELPNAMHYTNPIRIRESDNVSISHLDFSYTGPLSTDNRGIWIQGASLGTQIEDCIFSERASGLHLEDGYNVELECNTFYDNSIGVTVNGNSTFSSFAQNNFKCNETALSNWGTIPVNAKQNYWGGLGGSASDGGQGDYCYGPMDCSLPFASQSSCAPAIPSTTCDAMPPDFGDKSNGILTSIDYEIYPNPSNGVFTLRISEGSSQVQILDLNGRPIFTNSLQLAAGQHKMDLSDKAAGLYFMVIRTGQLVQYERLVIE